MRITKSRSLEAKTAGFRRAMLGLSALAAVALVGLAPAGVALATDGPDGTMPTSKEQCKKGGWKDFGFKNQGECVSWVTHHDNGGGYGGNNGTPNIHVGLNLNNSNNNVINIIIRWVVGG